MIIWTMGKKRSDDGRLTEISFVCRECRHSFKTEPDRVEDAPDLDHHPYRYFAACPVCGAACEQAAWERALLKAWTRATGPRTESGKAKVSQNLEGHPTPEETLRTRFNAMKHGIYARTATYFPARPGGYPHCEGCEHRHDACITQTACLKRTELFLRHHIAFDTRDPAMLMELRADTQAAIHALINDMILAIAQDGGPRLLSPEWYYDSEGSCHFVKWKNEVGEERQLMKNEAHPLLRVLMDFISKNTISLADMGMTPRAQEEGDVIKGHLDAQREDRQSLTEYQERQTKAIENLGTLIARSQDRIKRDPVLIEHGEQPK